MARAVGNELLERLRFAQGSQHHVGDCNTVGLTAGADVVGLAGRALVQHYVDTPTVVFDMDVVTHRLPPSVNGQRQAVDGVGDEEGNDLLGILIGAVVVGTAAYQHRDVEALAIGPDHHLAPSLAGRVGAARGHTVAFA